MIVEALWLALVIGLLLCGLMHRAATGATWFLLARERIKVRSVSAFSRELTLSQDPGGGVSPRAAARGSSG